MDPPEIRIDFFRGVQNSSLVGFNQLLVVAVTSWLLLGCYYDRADHLYGQGGTSDGGGVVLPCDTTLVVSFAGDLLPILDTHCNNCHSATAPDGGLDLTSHAGVSQSGNVGSLVSRLRLPMSDVGSMPRNGMPLPECNIVLFELWIAQGAPNN